MLKNVMGIKVNYEFVDNDKNITLVFLHGWGQNIEMMKPLGNKFINDFNILYIDLPGFGKSNEPDYPWTIYDYAKCINILINDLKLNNVNIIGHSIGGKIGLMYSSIYKVNKLICLASPYCKELNKLPLKTRIYKSLKKIPILKGIANMMKKYIGSTDYKNASEIMRGVLVQSINLDMINDVKKIKCPTLLIWGTLDSAVPINRAYELNSLIESSKVIEYEGATHYAYLEKLNDVAKNIDDFIRGD